MSKWRDCKNNQGRDNVTSIEERSHKNKWSVDGISKYTDVP